MKWHRVQRQYLGVWRTCYDLYTDNGDLVATIRKDQGGYIPVISKGYATFAFVLQPTLKEAKAKILTFLITNRLDKS